MKSGKLAAIMAMMVMSSRGFPFAIKDEETPEQIKTRVDRNKKERSKRQGLKEFEIDGIKVTALNYKNAFKKIKKQTTATAAKSIKKK